ncbi:MAG: threonylcarbamoyl-AMP synthase [Candidatus Buchananbacteria bacterium RBG_13_39_9]|uniref:Threonylcarbamoyl-AMP synthase n=1 Tax=Candidatus Buchananbacteria bacterium RBG_13_39_9 TaxID=1797531 RepID=A0A1G1XM47_9BACT|nr:MAG: threonylcarbamoyl-AMP synthase [Candidatus Buchananbacteria bacterium RBG_13_39_9]
MVLKINPQDPEVKKIQQAAGILKNGGLVVYPTDTIYGLGCDIFNKPAITKIYQLKKREKQKPLSILCFDLKQASQYALIPDYSFRIMKQNLPGPFTFILKAKSITPENFLAQNKTVGIRIPDNKICLELAKQLNNPIITTSLNISGEQVMTSPGQLSLEMKNKIDLIIDAGFLPQEASTVVDLTQLPPQIIRQGKGIINS